MYLNRLLLVVGKAGSFRHFISVRSGWVELVA